MATKKDKKHAKTKKTHQTHQEDEPKVVPQVRGLVDGSLNNLHVADHSNIAGIMLNSKLDASSNTRK